MNKARVIAILTTLVVFIQLLFGILLSDGLVPPLLHIGMGIAVLAVALVNLVVSRTENAGSKFVSYIPPAIVVGILIQVVAGFESLDTGSPLIAIVHLAVAWLIMVLALMGALFTRELNSSKVVLSGVSKEK